MKRKTSFEILGKIYDTKFFFPIGCPSLTRHSSGNTKYFVVNFSFTLKMSYVIFLIPCYIIHQLTLNSSFSLPFHRRETVEKLLNKMFEDTSLPNSDSSVLSGIATLSSMMEVKRPVIEGAEELITPTDLERIAQGRLFLFKIFTCVLRFFKYISLIAVFDKILSDFLSLGVHSTLEVLSTRMRDFYDVLTQFHKVHGFNFNLQTTNLCYHVLLYLFSCFFVRKLI